MSGKIGRWEGIRKNRHKYCVHKCNVFVCMLAYVREIMCMCDFIKVYVHVTE